MAVCLKTKVPIDLDEVDAGGTLVERVCDISIFRGACVACRSQLSNSVPVLLLKLQTLRSITYPLPYRLLSKPSHQERCFVYVNLGVKF